MADQENIDLQNRLVQNSEILSDIWSVYSREQSVVQGAVVLSSLSGSTDYQGKNSNGECKVTNLSNDLKEMFSDVEMDGNAKKAIIQSVLLKLECAVSLTKLQEKLKVLYEYEKNYLQLVKEYKEEIKFAATLQEDLRKERTKFFSESLKEVSLTLKESQVESNVASAWIKELVNSYTKSLDISSGLIEEHTIDMIGEIRQKAKQESIEIMRKNEQEE